ncbi:hypothetical protein D3C80_1610680 [compost metagenome]
MYWNTLMRCWRTSFQNSRTLNLRRTTMLAPARNAVEVTDVAAAPWYSGRQQ